MSRPRNSSGARARRSGYTWIELVTVVVVLAVLLAIGVPLLLSAREPAKQYPG
jgi:prepilin-type N-terminal cleavage/methylation domain-containing protein